MLSPFRADQVNGIPLGVPFLPKILKRKNYKNHFVGKWHAGFCNDRLTPTQARFHILVHDFDRMYSGYIMSNLYNTFENNLKERI